VPQLNRLESPIGAKELRHAFGIRNAAQTKRTRGILIGIDGVGVSHEVQHGASQWIDRGGSIAANPNDEIRMTNEGALAL
jgi:hypothetical protein